MHATEPGLLWAAVTRNKTVLAECGVITSAADSRAGVVVDLAQQILKKKPTPGWEFARARGLSAVKFHVHDAHEQSAGSHYHKDQIGFDKPLSNSHFEMWF